MAPPLPLTQTQRETLFVWTVITTNQKLMLTSGLTQKQIIAALQPLTIDATAMVAAALDNVNSFKIVRDVFRGPGITAAASDPAAERAHILAADDGNGNPVEENWGPDGAHPPLENLRTLFNLQPGATPATTARKILAKPHLGPIAPLLAAQAAAAKKPAARKVVPVTKTGKKKK
jgi:hypothetical protein